MGNCIKLGIVAVLFNSIEEFTELIVSIKPIETCVNKYYFIDNSSDVIAKKNFELIQNNFANYYYNHFPENIGSAGGFKAGQIESHKDNNDWTWLLDQDGTIEPRDIKRLFEYFAEYTDCVLAPKLVVDKISSQTSFRKKKNINSQFSEYYDSKFTEIHLAGTHGIIIHSNVFNRIGYYDNLNFYVGWEDFDFSMRLLKAKIKMYFLPDVQCYHPDVYQKHNFNLLITDSNKVLKKLIPVYFRFKIVLNNKKNNSRFYNDVYSHSYVISKYTVPWKSTITLLCTEFILLNDYIVSVFTFQQKRRKDLWSFNKAYLKGFYNGIKDKLFH